MSAVISDCGTRMRLVTFLGVLVAFWTSFSPLAADDEPTASELKDAVRYGYFDQVKQILRQAPHLTDQSIDGYSSLNWAVIDHHFEIARFLIEQGADVNKRARNGETVPILEARTVKMARLLIEHGAELDPEKLPENKSPLSNAARNGWSGVARMFVEEGLPVDFDSAVSLGWIDEVKRILSKEPWRAKPPARSLHSAASRGDIKLAMLLLAHGADPNIEERYINIIGPYTPLTNAVSSGHFEMTKLLLDAGADPNVSGGRNHDNLFLYAIAYLDVRFVREMLEHGADVRRGDSWNRNITPLHVAAALGGSAQFGSVSRVGQPASLQGKSREVLQKVRELLDHGADIDAITEDGASPLLFAALASNLDVCELLQKRGARLDVHSACVLGHNDSVIEMLKESPDLVQKDDGPLGYSLLHYAAQYGNADLVRRLLELGADVTSTAPAPSHQDAGGFSAYDDEGVTPLHLAASRGDLRIVRQLVEAGADVNVTTKDLHIHGYSPLTGACFSGHVPVVKYLLDQNTKVDWENDDDLIYAATQEPEILRLLLDASGMTDLDNDLGRTLLSTGIENPAVVELVRNRGGQLDIYQACQLGDIEVVKQLLKDDPSRATVIRPVYPEESPLEVAVEHGHFDVASLLFDKGAGEALDAEHRQALLSRAAHNGHLEIIKFLITKGYSVASPDRERKTLLHDAASGGSPEVVQFLLEQGFDPNAQDIRGETPLIDAAGAWTSEWPDDYDEWERRVVASAQLLIDEGADVNAVDNLGYTPLHEAAREGRRDFVALLLENGAEVNARNYRDETPLQMAKDELRGYGLSFSPNDRQPVISLLREAGGVE